jgi:hypothetical protein
MAPIEIIGISSFGMLVLIALTVAICQDRRQRKQIDAYCFTRGYTLLQFDGPVSSASSSWFRPTSAGAPSK